MRSRDRMVAIPSYGKMKFLVTGASGYIGGRLIERLTEKGLETRAFVRRTSNIERLKYLKNIEICYGDLTDIPSVERAVKGIQIVYHVGALVSDWGDYQRFYEINYRGTRNVFKASVRADVKKFIYTSTIDVLDLKYRGPIKENLPYDPAAGNYSRSKIEAEKFIRENMHRIPTVIIRPPAVYGPEDPQCTTRSLNTAQKNLLFLVNRGKGIFPHVYIDNLIEALLLAAQREDAAGEIFNISDGLSTTAKEFFTHLNKIAGKGKIRLSFSYPVAWSVALIMDDFARLTGKPPFLSWTALRFLTLKCRMDISKAQDKLGYNPSITLNEGMRRVKIWWDSLL